MNYVNSVTNRKPANGEPVEFAVSPSVRPSVRPALELVKGGYAHVLEDVGVLLSECRAAGLDPQYDNLRREAAGRVAKIVERDERHAVVRAHIPSVGEVWLSLTSFSGRTDVQGKDKLDDNNNYKNDKNSVHGSSEVGVAEKIQELEAELQVGRETVAEALQAVGELHGRLQRTRSEKRHAVDRFHQLRNRAVQLGKECTLSGKLSV